MDVDHYLLKPWEPPEEKLYPVVDAMIDAYLASPETPMRQTKMVRHRWSAPLFEVRDFLTRNAVPYRWLSVEEPEGRRLLDAAQVGAERWPWWSRRTARPSTHPRPLRSATVVGLSTTPTTKFYDLAWSEVVPPA